MSLVCLCAGEEGLGQGPQRASTTKAYPSFSLFAAGLSGTYRDTSYNEAKDTRGESGAIKFSGSDVIVTGAISGIEVGIESRTLLPSGIPWWGGRSEFEIFLSYYFSRFPWLSPVAGYLRTKQTGDRDDPEAPPAFIETNTSLVTGAKTRFRIWDFGGNGFMVVGQWVSLSALEKKRNFGDEQSGSLAYYFATAGFKAAIMAGQVRNFYNAEIADPENEDKMLQVRHEYWATRVGLYLEY